MIFMNEWFKVSYDIHLCFPDTQRQAGGWESHLMKIRKGFSCILIKSCWHGEAWSKLNRTWATYVFGLGSRFGFPWLVLSWKWWQKLGKPKVIDQVLTVWGTITAEVVVSIPGWLQTVSQVLFYIWPGHPPFTNMYPVSQNPGPHDSQACAISSPTLLCQGCSMLPGHLHTHVQSWLHFETGDWMFVLSKPPVGLLSSMNVICNWYFNSH